MRFQAHAEVLHLLHLNPWAETSWPFCGVLGCCSAVFVFPFGVCGLCFRVCS